MHAGDLEEIQSFLVFWHVAVLLAVALGAGYSVFRSARLRREAAPPLRWTDFYLVTFGRATRRAFWLAFVLPFFLVTFAILFVWESPLEMPRATFAVLGASVWPAIAIGAKRLHDRDKSAWYLLIVLIPFFGLLWYLVELGFFRGTAGPNRFGPNQVASS